MKKFKISLLAVIALIFGCVASSFTVHHSQKDSGGQWFIYKGHGSMTDPTNYNPGSGDPQCPNTDVLCAVFVTDDGGLPQQDELQDLYDINQFTAPIDNKVELRDEEVE